MKYICILVLSSALFGFTTSRANVSENYSAKDYSYLLGKVDGISDSLLKMHFKLYEGYVTNTNKLLLQIKQSEGNPVLYGPLKRRLGWEYDGMYLHELYFENLGGKRDLPKKSSLYLEIERNFGSFTNFLDNFKQTGLIRGIGWVILYRDPIKKNLYNLWINEHDLGHLPNGTPLLVMDVWEHAYLTEFGLDRGKYIDTFLKSVNWDIVSKRSKSLSFRNNINKRS